MSRIKQKQPTEDQNQVAIEIDVKSNINPFEKYSRNEHGLIKIVDYHFNEDGSIDWRKMVKDEFLYPNKGWFDARKKTVPSSIDGLQDNQLLIMLGGIKEIAKLRGYDFVHFDVNNISSDYVTAKCSIGWIPNYESQSTHGQGVVYQDVANATLANTDDFCAKFLETIACNRAFVRCVRNFLNIHIVGADEIDKSKTGFPSGLQENDFDSSTIAITPTNILEKMLRDKHNIINFDGFKNLLRDMWSSDIYRNESVKDWLKFEDIPAKEARLLLSIISKK